MIEVGLTAVVLVARPIFLCVRLHGARGTRCAGANWRDDREVGARLNARKLSHLRALCGGVSGGCGIATASRLLIAV